MTLAIQEHKRTMKIVEDWEFEAEQFKGWRFVGTSLTDEKGGEGFILAPNVVLEETIEHAQKVWGIILSIKIRMCGLKLRMTNVYAPHEDYSETYNDNFYQTMKTCALELDVKCKGASRFGSVISMQ